jgi:glycosyltransferase involved in cell wall biosynthesis
MESRDLEFILVENGSTDNSKEYFAKYIDGKNDYIKVIYVEENLGYGYGLQQGMKAAIGEYVGWIHADMQMPPEELINFFDTIENSEVPDRLFLKGQRCNRSTFDKFFTFAQSVFSSILFGKKLYDVGAIPVLFHRSLLSNIDDMPNDFSIELYIYREAVNRNFIIKRYKVKLRKRENGTSSWSHSLFSKIKQSIRAMDDGFKIKKGEKVL